MQIFAPALLKHGFFSEYFVISASSVSTVICFMCKPWHPGESPATSISFTPRHEAKDTPRFNDSIRLSVSFSSSPPFPFSHHLAFLFFYFCFPQSQALCFSLAKPSELFLSSTPARAAPLLKGMQ